MRRRARDPNHHKELREAAFAAGKRFFAKSLGETKVEKAHRLNGHSMKRTYAHGMHWIVVVTDSAEIRTISNNSRFDRDFTGHGAVRNVQRLRKMPPHFLAQQRIIPSYAAAHQRPRRRSRRTVVRTKRQGQARVKHGPLNWRPWPNGSEGSELEKLDLLVQQSIGRDSTRAFTTTEERLAAAHAVPRLKALPTCPENAGVAHRRRAGAGPEAFLASMVNGDLAAGRAGLITARQCSLSMAYFQCAQLAAPTRRFDLQ